MSRSSREALPDVREWSGRPQGCLVVIGRLSGMSGMVGRSSGMFGSVGRPSRMSRSSRETLLDVRE